MNLSSLREYIVATIIIDTIFRAVRIHSLVAHGGSMTSYNFTRHAIVTVVTFVLYNLLMAVNPFHMFGLLNLERTMFVVGSFYGLAIVLGPPQGLSLVRRIGVILGSGVVCVAAVWLGMFLTNTWPIHAIGSGYAIGTASILGALLYWLFLRTTVLRNLSLQSLGVTTIIVGMATVAITKLSYIRILSSHLEPTLLNSIDLTIPLWWFAFSVSLFVSDRMERMPVMVAVR